MRLSLLAVLVLTATASAQTITHLWVDAVNGKDTNPGTYALPFQSITKGVATGQQDTVIHVLPGTYSPSKTGETFTILFPATAQNVTLLGTDAQTCVLDCEQAVGTRNACYFFVDAGARDIEIAHLTIKNGAFQPTVPWYASAIWWTGVLGLELHHCVIESCESGIYSAGASQDVAVHDNVFWGCNIPVRFRQDASNGAKNCRFYHNFVANSTGGYTDTVSPSANDPGQTFVNNLVMNNPGDGFRGGPTSGMVFENNNSWNNGGQNYALNQTLSPSNLSVDPKIVDYAKRDFRLLAGSPLIEAGYAVPQPLVANDFYGGARVSDHDGDARSVPDIGVHEVPGITLTVSNWGQGKTAQFAITAHVPQVGPAFLFLSTRTGSLVLDPFGSIGLDVASMIFLTSTSSPGTVSIPIPSNPSLNGEAAYFQAFAYNGQAFRPSGRLDLTL